MKLKPNYLLIPLVTILVALIGSMFTDGGMSWYDMTLVRPELTPPKWIFPVAWTTIFILSTISALIIFNKSKRNFLFYWIVALFLANAILNLLWSYLFFTSHLIMASFWEMWVLELTVLLLVIFCWKTSKLASILLLPYLIWVGFATFLTYQIVQLNPETSAMEDQNFSDELVLDDLNSGDTVASPLTVTGEIKGSWFFEATFPVSLLDNTNAVIATTTAQAQGDWMTANFVPFTFTLNFTATPGTSGTLVFEKDNPSGLPENAQSISIPVNF